MNRVAIKPLYKNLLLATRPHLIIVRKRGQDLLLCEIELITMVLLQRTWRLQKVAAMRLLRWIDAAAGILVHCCRLVISGSLLKDHRRRIWVVQAVACCCILESALLLLQLLDGWGERLVLV